MSTESLESKTQYPVTAVIWGEDIMKYRRHRDEYLSFHNWHFHNNQKAEQEATRIVDFSLIAKVLVHQDWMYSSIWNAHCLLPQNAPHSRIRVAFWCEMLSQESAWPCPGSNRHKPDCCLKTQTHNFVFSRTEPDLHPQSSGHKPIFCWSHRLGNPWPHLWKGLDCFFSVQIKQAPNLSVDESTFPFNQMANPSVIALIWIMLRKIFTLTHDCGCPTALIAVFF